MIAPIARQFVHTLAVTGLCLVATSLPAAEPPPLKIPAITAYSAPDSNGIRLSKTGTRNWRGSAQRLNWYGNLPHRGELFARVHLRLPLDAQTRLQLTVGEQSLEAQARGAGPDATAVLEFGPFTLDRPGYTRLELASLNPDDTFNGDVETLELRGAPTVEAHFNLVPRRNCASVHLAYPFDKQQQVDCLAVEVTAIEDPVGTFYMACGFHRGYFGMQVNSPTERRIIFSVWDAGSGSNADTRDTVSRDNHVTLLAKGAGVHTEVFGHEGTGGHSHLKFAWKTGEKQRFVVTAEPAPDRQTIYSGYYFHPERNQWMLISSMRAPKDGGYLRGLHSFSENFDGSNGNLRRKALFGNQQVHTVDGQWRELTVSTFSHDPTGRADRRDRFMGLEQDAFFLSSGGFVEGYTEFGQRFERPAAQAPPAIAPGDLPPRLGLLPQSE
ncbi:MAG: DUF3472 domain-containing protein [Planctomycetaceae bacterium]